MRAQRKFGLAAPALCAALLALAGCGGGVREYDAADAPRFDAAIAAKRPAPLVALVLGGGGPRGFAHIGVIKALDRAGIRPDLIVGTSVGTLVGALYASGLDGAALEQMALDLKPLELIRIGPGARFSGDGDALERLVRNTLGDRPLEALRPPVVVTVATELGALALFNCGNAAIAVRASSALPAVFQPVRIHGALYLDADLISPVPVKAARSLGATVVIAVDVSAYLESTPPEVRESWRVRDRARTAQVETEIHQADVVLHPDIGYYVSHRESFRRRAIDAAEQLTDAHIPAIRAVIARARERLTRSER